jgi:hypothetical protein
MQRTIHFQAGRWEGQTVCIIASGPSLTGAQIEEAKGKEAWRYIAINDSCRLASFADVLYACDGKWWDKYHADLQFEGEKWTQDLHAKRRYGLNWVLGKQMPGLGYEAVHFGRSSGYQAINLAFLWGAKRIVLLGFDCKDSNGRAHWFGQHPQGLNQEQPYKLWIANFAKLANDLQTAGVEVINCSTDTALTCFKQVSIDQLN